MKDTLKRVDLCLINQLILSLVALIIGVVVMIFKSFGLIDIVLYISILFYIFSFFSILLYFIRRKEGDYEILILSLINIITATFMFIFKADNPPMILGAAMTIYTILIVLNRGFKVLKLKKDDNFMWIIKFIITFLIAFLGMLTTYNLFNEVTVQTMMFGFYFMSFGFMSIVENVIEIFVTDTVFKKILSKILVDEKVKLEEFIEIVDFDSPKKETKPIKEKKETTKKSPKQQVEKSKMQTKTVKTKTNTKPKSTTKKIKETKVTKEEIDKPKKVGRPKKSNVR